MQVKSETALINGAISVPSKRLGKNSLVFDFLELSKDFGKNSLFFDLLEHPWLDQRPPPEHASRNPSLAVLLKILPAQNVTVTDQWDP